LEAQVAALADDIAYVNHDIDDGLRASLFSVDELKKAPLVGGHARDVLKACGELELSRFIGQTVRSLMSALVMDLLNETHRRVGAAAPPSAAAVRAHKGPLGGFTTEMAAEIRRLKGFLFERMYRHPRVMDSMGKARQVVAELFSALSADPGLLPPDWALACGMPNDAATAAVVRDYIAGMTDRFALQEHARITHTEISL
jgi:dGTPase